MFHARSMIATVVVSLVASLAAVAPIAADPAKAPAADKKPAADKPADKKPDVVSDADAKRFLAFYDKLVSIVVADQDDCAKMATEISTHVDANLELIKTANAAKEHGKELPAGIKERFAKLTDEQLKPALTKKCIRDKAVQTAFEKLAAGTTPPPASSPPPPPAKK
jgi:hypothetical protein